MYEEAYVLIAKETISRQFKMECCDFKPIFRQRKMTAELCKSTDP